MPKHHPKSTRQLLSAGQREVHVIRDGELVWGGYLWAVKASTDAPNIGVQADGWFSRLLRRHIDVKLDFEDEDQIDIAWGVIDWTQQQEKDGADLGIVRATHGEGWPIETGVLRTRRFKPWNRTNIGQLIQELSEAKHGFDFNISPDKKFMTYYPKRQEDNGVVFELGKNIKKISQLDDDASAVVTELSGMGSGMNRNRCIAVVSNTGSIADYGLLQDTVDLSRIRHYENLEHATKEQFRLRKKSRWQPVITATLGDPGFDGYSVGDLCRVKAKDGYIDVNQKFRLIAKRIAVSTEGEETVDLTFDQDLAEEP